MRQLHITAAECLYQLYIMIAWYAEGLSRLHQAGDEAKHPRRLRPSINQVSNENQLSTLRRLRRILTILHFHRVAKNAQQLQQLIEATMHIANDVERPVLGLAVVP